MKNMESVHIYVLHYLTYIACVVYRLSVRTGFSRPEFDPQHGLKLGTQLLVAQPVRSRALNTVGSLYVP